MGIDPGLVALVCAIAAMAIWLLWPVDDDPPPRKPPDAPGGSA